MTTHYQRTAGHTHYCFTAYSNSRECAPEVINAQKKGVDGSIEKGAFEIGMRAIVT